MKKFRILSMALLLVLALSGCGGFSEGLEAGMNDAMNGKTETEEPEVTAEPETVTEEIQETEPVQEETAEPAQAETKSENTKTEEVATVETTPANLLMEAEVQVHEVMNGAKTEVIGERAEVVFSKDVAKTLTKEQFVEFCYEVVDGSGYNWFTISFEDGTGIVFAGSNASNATYGEIDADGAILEGYGYIMAYESGTVNYSE